MGNGAKISIAATALVVIVMAGSVALISPTRALSAAVMRDCMGVVKENALGAKIISVAAIQSEPNKRKLEDFSRATQAVISRGGLIPSEPSVLVEFQTERGNGKALCEYSAQLETDTGTYSGVSADGIQIGTHSLSTVDLALKKRFDVGRLDRVLSLVPIFGVDQKFYLD